MAMSKADKAAFNERVRAMAETPEGQRILAAHNNIVRMADPSQPYAGKNPIRIALQWEELRRAHPELPEKPTACAGFYEWHRHGRKVRKGMPGLYIVVMGEGKAEKDAESEDRRAGGGAPRTYAGGAYVWDISQTEERVVETAEDDEQELEATG